MGEPGKGEEMLLPHTGLAQDLALPAGLLPF